MSQLTIEQITETLASVPDPESGRKLSEAGMLKDVSVDGTSATVVIALTSHSRPLHSDVRLQVTELLKKKHSDLESVDVQFVEHDRKPQKLGQVGLTVRSVIAVGSGKGGVGKSSLSAMLALSLHRAGCKVGLLDADVYGPSIPHVLGITEKPEQQDKKILPIDYHGMKVLSIGLMVPAEQAVIWRGPMLHSAMTTFLRDTAWGELDYLIIDMPPGTGDIALSLSQMLPLTGSVIVCTPQDVALIDAIKAVGMMEKVKIPILGMIENMSGFVCPDNNKRYDIFGRGGAVDYAKQKNIPLLGEIPILMPVREMADKGRIMDCFNDEAIATVFENVAYNLARSLADTAIKEVPMPQLPVL